MSKRRLFTGVFLSARVAARISLGAALSSAAALLSLAALFSLAALGCASRDDGERRAQSERERVARATESVSQDPLVEAQLAAIEAARAREAAPRIVDEVELRVEDDYIDDDHRLSLVARVPVNRPAELSAQREVLAAETKLAISRLEEVSLQRRAELCFPSVEALAAELRRALYADFVDQRRALLDWNDDWRSAGTIDELRGARFELESRIKLASWLPDPVPVPETVVAVLPEIGPGPGVLVRSPDLVRATVQRHNPSVAMRQATAERYRALAERARARNQPWVKFVDIGYEHRTERSDNGVSGQIAFEIPLGGEKTNVSRYEALVRMEGGEARGIVAEQMAGTLRALEDLHLFESNSDRWRELLRLADEAEDIALRWWSDRLAKPADVAALLDEAFSARNAVVEARERAGSAYCTVLAMSGVELEAWPRAAAPAGALVPARD